MSDYDDYENNLFFEPIGDMSKLNDCNDGKRSVDVLVSAVDKCKNLEEKLANAEKMRDLQAEYVAKLEEKLKIATEALENIASDKGFCFLSSEKVSYAKKILKRIKE